MPGDSSDKSDGAEGRACTKNASVMEGRWSCSTFELYLAGWKSPNSSTAGRGARRNQHLAPNFDLWWFRKQEARNFQQYRQQKKSSIVAPRLALNRVASWRPTPGRPQLNTGRAKLQYVAHSRGNFPYDIQLQPEFPIVLSIQVVIQARTGIWGNVARQSMRGTFQSGLCSADCMRGRHQCFIVSWL